MQRNSTPQLLIKHLYNETTASEASAVFHALQQDELLQQEYARLQEAKFALDDAGGDDPGFSTIRNILRYSEKYQMETV